MSKLKILKKSPELKLNNQNEDIFDLHKTQIDDLALLVFYRGIHCPVCRDYLQELEKLSQDFKDCGVKNIIAISGDSKEKAKEISSKWNVNKINILHEQSEESMREWGLYISNSIKDVEPKKFGEPGLFLINQNHEVLYAAYNSMPFARPQLKDILSAVKFMKEKDYPPRGQA